MAEANKEIYVLDTSALLAFIEDEDGAAYTEDLLIRAERYEISIYVCFVSLMEVMYITLQEKDEAAALSRVELLKSLFCSIEESSEVLNLAAARLKAKNAYHRLMHTSQRYVTSEKPCSSIRILNLKNCRLLSSSINFPINLNIIKHQQTVSLTHYHIR